MFVTSAQANKLLRKLSEEHRHLLAREQAVRTFVAATVENLEDARPPYDYRETQARLEALEAQIRAVKHAINRFNLSQTLPETELTIDQALVYLPQLSARREKLARMRAVSPKERRESVRATNLIEYTYANYNPAEAEADFVTVSDELSRLQNALDLVNSTVSFELALEL